MNCAECEKVGVVKNGIAKNMCWMHYRRLLRNGSPDVGARIPSRPCKTDGCEKKATNHGLCPNCTSKFKHAERKKNNLCLVCGGQRKEGYMRCERCLITVKLYKRKRRNKPCTV